MKPALTTLALLFLCTSGSQAQDARLRVPEFVTCDPNMLTSWTGFVTRYRHEAHSLSLVLATDAGTTESLELEFTGEEALLARLFIEGRAFQFHDWQKIESAPGVLRNRMRLTAWVCEDTSFGTLIDWQTGTETQSE
jgi:hypothetical protein